MTTDDQPFVAALRWPYLPRGGYVHDGPGPTRVVTDEPDPEFKPHPLGFAPRPRHRADVAVDSPPQAGAYLVPGVGRHLPAAEMVVRVARVLGAL